MTPDPMLQAYAREFPAEVAALLANGELDEAAAFCRALPEVIAATVMAALPGSMAQRILAETDPERIGALLGAADFEQAVGLLSRAHPSTRSTLIEQVTSPRRRQLLTSRFAYAEGTLGAIAARDYISVPLGATLRDVVAELHAMNIEPGEEPPIYILEGGGRLHGTLDLYRALETENLDRVVEQCLLEVVPLPAEMPLASALASSRWNDSTVLPVVDREQRLLGSVTLQRVREACSSEAGLDGFDALLDLSHRYLEVLGGIATVTLGRSDRQ